MELAECEGLRFTYGMSALSDPSGLSRAELEALVVELLRVVSDPNRDLPSPISSTRSESVISEQAFSFYPILPKDTRNCRLI